MQNQMENEMETGWRSKDSNSNNIGVYREYIGVLLALYAVQVGFKA